MVLLLGKKLDFGLKFGDDSVLSTKANIIHVDHEISVLDQTKKSVRPDRLIISAQADPLSIIDILNSNNIGVNKKWINEVQSALNYTPKEWIIL